MGRIQLAERPGLTGTTVTGPIRDTSLWVLQRDLATGAEQLSDTYKTESTSLTGWSITFNLTKTPVIFTDIPMGPEQGSDVPQPVAHDMRFCWFIGLTAIPC